MAKGNTPSPRGNASSGGGASTGSGTGSASTFPSTAAQRRQMMNTLTQQSYLTSNAVTPNASTPANVLAARSAHQQAISNLQNAISNIPYASSQAQAQSDFNQAYQQYQKTQAAFQNALKAQQATAAAPQQQTQQQKAQQKAAALQSAQQAPQQSQTATTQSTQNSTPSNATSPNVKSYFGDNNGGFKDGKDLVANQVKITAWMDAAVKKGGMDMSTQTPQWYAAEMMGFNAKPNVVQSISQLPNQANRVVMYRGVDDYGGSGAARAQMFKTGDNFAGIGIYGDGTYFQLSYAGAQDYANTKNKANIITASLDTSKLRIISVSQLKTERAKILANPKTSPRVKQLIQNGGSLTDSYGNVVQHSRRHGDGALGTLATLLGYDAIYVPGGNGGKVAQNQPTNAGKNNDFFVILNRGAVDVKAGY